MIPESNEGDLENRDIKIMSGRLLSKSKIMSGIQCRKRLYLEVNRPDLIVISSDTERIFQMGNQVGEVARQLTPGGKLIESQDNLSKAIDETSSFLNNSPDTPLFEATFSHNGVLIRADVFMKASKGYQLIEVKSTTGLKDYHKMDAAIQSWVIEGSGYPLEKVSIGHVDNSFVYLGNGNYAGLLKYEDITNDVVALKKDLPDLVADFTQVLNGDMPCVDVGDQCYDPFECPFLSFCSPKATEYSIDILPRVGKVAEELAAEGIEDIRFIPEGRLKSELHEKVRRVTVSGKAETDPALTKCLKKQPYPRYYLDFETIQFAVPIWAGTKPYQQLPFQWSCHIEEQPMNLKHSEFLDTSGQAPMKLLANALIASLGVIGPIFVYSSFEKMVIGLLSEMFPELRSNLDSLKNRLVDLLPLVRQYYYHPNMKGSWSIKAVLPTVAPDLNYGNLEEVKDGTGAQSAYLESISAETSDERRSELRERMLKYCKMDSFAMVKLVHFFSDK